MTQQWTVPGWAVVACAAVAVALVLLGVACLVRLRRLARRTEDRTAALTAELADLRAELERRPTEHPAGAGLVDHPSYVITRLGDGPSPDTTPPESGGPAPSVAPGAFADAVVREGALRSASLLHGVRRALAPETRHRIRFEMRREVKRQRKARRSRTREALRDVQARQRAEEPAA